MIPRLLSLVIVFVVIFEGQFIHTLLTHKVSSSSSSAASSAGTSASQTAGASTSSDAQAASGTSGVSSAGNTLAPDEGLAGLASLAPLSASDAQTASAAAQSESQTDQTQSSGEQIDSAAVVPAQDSSVDDSYFSDAVFIGDSRMEGFRNASGITQGTFLTGVGLSINDMDKQIISTSDGTISVYQGLSGRQYSKIYLMLGTNDLGFYPWDSFQGTFEKVIKQFHDLQPGAIIYVCSVIYVEESKIAAGFEYDNNENVQKINGYILSTCEDLWYSYYVNLNEILSDGNHELISGASADGIHLQPEYCVQMLTYLKSHYIPDTEWQAAVSANGGSSSASAETESSETAGAASEPSSGSSTAGISAG